jgi:hypothetical protein
MKGSIPNSGPVRLGVGVFLFACFSVMGVSPIYGAQTTTQTTGSTAPASQQNSQQNSLPAGTILPVVLRTSVSFDKCKPGHVLRGKIDKDVSLPNGEVIRKGSEVEGHIVQVTPAANGSGANVAMQFDKLDVGGQKVPIVTNLRAIADSAPALWAFSGDAQGNYGIDNLLIAHAGSTAPVGTIVLASQAQNLKLEKGDALLLLVD